MFFKQKTDTFIENNIVSAKLSLDIMASEVKKMDDLQIYKSISAYIKTVFE
jgi:hypothetical protein